ncbi:PLDc N-terminal domain-containing protein [Nigerium massiliense]|uniref:PLDc N-terminal domain-containing protein n=1 Tax=Nigerium massiliense TaxID=1522317 RepID=UPI0006940E0C|nr:PLDc N-terminal domain-containing protein [Nigerium massiliense]
MARVVLIVLVVALVIYALVDLHQAERDTTRLMPWWLWLAAVLCLPGVGALGWLVLGRPTPPVSSGGRPPKPGVGALGWLVLGRPTPPVSSGGRPPKPPRAPDDDPDFLRGL